MPHCVEPAVGLNRLFLAFLCEALVEERIGDDDVRIVARLHPRIAPVKVAVLPVVKSNGALVTAAHQLAQALRRWMVVDVDVTQSIGKRYRRCDEVGTPICLTLDDRTLADGTVTARDRDTMKQVRVPADAVLAAAAGCGPGAAALTTFAQLTSPSRGAAQPPGGECGDEKIEWEPGWLSFAQVAQAAV